MPSYTFPDWVTVVTGPLGIIGFALALIGLRKARKAADASRQAVSDTLRLLSQAQLGNILPEFDRIQEDLDHALAGKNPQSISRVLAQWRSAASRARGLLTGLDETSAVMQVIDESITSVGAAKAQLQGKRPPEDVTRTLRLQMSTVVAQVGSIANDMKLATQQKVDV